MISAMYCQGCGAKNTDDARFCNMCGARIAAAGAPGGPISAPTQLGVASPATPDPEAKDVPLAHAATVQGSSPVPRPIEPAKTAVAGGVGGPAPAAADDPAPKLPDTRDNDDDAYASGEPALRSRRAEAEEYGGVVGGATGPMNASVSVSLEAIGVRSSRRTWAAIVAISVSLVLLGALGMHLLESDDAPAPEAGHAAEDDPFVIGTPVPEGEGAPGVDFVSGTPRDTPGTQPIPTGADAPEEGDSTAPATSGSDEASTARGGSSSGASAGSRRGTTGAGASQGSGDESASGSDGPAAGSGTTGGRTTEATGGGSSDASGDGAGSDASGGGSGTGPDAPTAGSSAEDSGGETPDPDPDGAPASRDLEMEMYVSRVRYVIQRYYASRAQSCFDMATRNTPSLSGTVVISMTIGADGSVSSARVARNTTGDTSLGNCLAGQVRQWRLGEPPGGESVTMNMPFSR